MAGRKLPGGAEIITRLRDYAVVIREQLDFDRKLLVLKPEQIEDRRDLALDYLRLLIQALDEDLPPLLERAERNRKAASLPDRVALLEQEFAELRRLIESRSLRLMDPPRPTGTGGKD